MGSLELMEPRIESNYEDTAEDIGQVDLDFFEVTTTAGPSTTVAPTSSTTTTTSTTVAPTTTTTTTTAPPTTTAAPTTTTTPSNPIASASFKDRSGLSSWCDCPRARMRIWLDDEFGFNLSYAWIEVQFVTSSGTVYAGEKYVNANGRTDFGRNLDEDEFPVEVTITYVEDYYWPHDEMTPEPATFTLDY